MYDSATDYVTRDTYEEFSGVDLETELKDGQTDNPTLKVSIFLKQQQQWMYNYMRYRFNTSQWDTDWSDTTFAEALLWQIKYVLDNGENGMLDRTAYRILKDEAMANPKHIG